MIRRPPRSTRTETRVPYTPLFRSWVTKTHFTHHCTTSATRCSFPPSYSYVCGSRGPGGECERGAPGQPSVRSIAVPARRASLNWTAGRHRFYQGNSCHIRMPLNANRTCPPQHPRADRWLSLDRCDSIRRRRFSGAWRRVRRASSGARRDHCLGLVGPSRSWLFTLRDRLATVRSGGIVRRDPTRSEEHTSELQSLMRISYAV